ncbi:DUF5107 domain-containing protein [Aquimarina algiphila]|uniref:DUF5107 domain-containing protein n=1 Tax=Aquimarina algiphila TaxID=2047982 RepID=UPI00232C9E32|nr:DUF5107 domain-containing protein [Aquimarina algiphila]
MKNKCIFIFAGLISLCTFSQVKVYEGTEIIPTYKIHEKERSPIFFTGRSVQGAEGRMYPYPSQSNLGDSLVDMDYNMVYLENEYIKVKILPEFGGRLFSAIDKTNGHELFHTNSVIKPSLIGTLGAWVSGGIEWCFPHHHRTTSMLPSDYTIVKNKDGSVTVWIGETEKTMRLRGIVGITLRPGCSFIETDYRINNTNTLTKTFLFWANVAITANEDFRTFWPPSQEIGVYHNNTSFTRWPISNEKYHHTDYTAGVDLTWWKNHPNPESFFFWNGTEGFIGGYDYSQKAGTVHVGDPYENKTSKLWQFGPGLAGQNARRKLTDDNKAYVELMTGTFSNNQPDYSWIAPHSVKDAKNYWYPLRDIEISKNSTVDASVTLQLKGPKTVFYGFNTTKAFQQALVTLKYNDEIIIKKDIDIDPATPFTTSYTTQKEIDEHKLYVELKDKDGNILVSYAPYKSKKTKLPKPQEKTKRPEDIESVEDLYLTGRFVEQFFRPGHNPDDYYVKGLKKDPENYRINIAMGIRRLHQYRYQEALQYLQKAANKLQIQYYQPKEGELYYYMAIAQKELGKTDEAYRNFSQATWYYQWYSAGYYQLALMESTKKNYKKALEYIHNAYTTNIMDGRIVVLYSALLRKLNAPEKASELIDKLITYDPLNFSAYYEKSQLQGAPSLAKWHKNMQDVNNNYLEVATNYMNAGLIDDGITLLSSLKKPQNPLIYYYLAWFYTQADKLSEANTMLKLAKNTSLSYCFPYRQETEIVLKNAIKIDPLNASAHYLLGNLLYDNRPDDAILAWQKASKIENKIPMVWRNLAFAAFYHQHSTDNAISYITKAIKAESDIPLWFTELAKYYDVSNIDSRECLDILQKHLDIVKKDVSGSKTLIKLYNLNGNYDEAIQLLKNHHFRTWEGGRGIYHHYVDTYTLKAIQLANNQKFKEAITHLETALVYPKNLEVGKSSTDEKNALIYYYMGLAYDKLSMNEKAKVNYQKSTESKNARYMYDLLYFQAKSFEKLGNIDKANELFNSLLDKGEELIEKGTHITGVAIEDASSRNNKLRSSAYYLKALGNKGLKNTTKAQQFFELAIKEYKNNLWARTLMNQ